MSARSGGADPRRRGGARSLSAPAVVVVALVVILASLGVSVGVVAALARGARAVGTGLTSPVPAASRYPGSVTESMKILTADPFGPRYTNSSWTVHEGEVVTLEITSDDDGSAPLMGMQARMFDSVHGTLGGTETVAGKPIASVANGDVSHTFTVVGLGLNLPIPVAPTGGTVTVVARFVADRSGTFVWQCYAPCGDGTTGMGGPMSTMNWMEGQVKVVA